MGLFGKKPESTIVFVGEFTDNLGAMGVMGLGMDKKNFRDYYRPRLSEQMDGAEPAATFWFDEWSRRQYRLMTLLDVKEKGLTPMDMGERGVLMKEVTEKLTAKYGKGLRMKDLCPDCVIEQGRYAGIFFLVFHLPVKV